MCGAITSEDSVETRSVWPSGSDFATMPVPIRPAAPARFSTITDWPSRLCICGWISRDTISAPPPGANGTMMRTGRLG